MPVAVGFGLGIGPLAGFLAGAIGSGALMAVFLANSGGAWDNAKKIVEDGAHGGKGSQAHEATIIGDTVGDPFKDTAGPAINPLLKVMNLVSVLIAPAIVSLTVGDERLAGRSATASRRSPSSSSLAAVAYSKSKDIAIGNDSDPDCGAAEQQHPVSDLAPREDAEGPGSTGTRPLARPDDVPRHADHPAGASACRGTSTDPTAPSQQVGEQPGRPLGPVGLHRRQVTGRSSVASSSAHRASGSTSCS